MGRTLTTISALILAIVSHLALAGAATAAALRTSDATTSLAAGNASTVCDQYASPSGTDASGNGTAANPYATPSKLVSALRSGQTGCLRAGVYGTPSSAWRFTNGTGVALTAYPGEAATVNGFPDFDGATGMTVSYLNFDLNNTGGARDSTGISDGCTNTGAYAFEIDASSSFTLTHSNIYETDVDIAHRGVAVGIGWSTPVSNTTVSDNRIHDFGGCADLDHGIYDDQSTGDHITGNWIYNGLHGAAIQMYPHPQNATISGNVMDNVGLGVYIGSDEGAPITSNITVTHNVVSNPNQCSGSVGTGACPAAGFATYWGGPAGTGNTFMANDVFNAPQGGCGGNCGGVSDTGTIASDPQYVAGAAGDYRAQASAVSGYGLWNGDIEASSAAPTLPGVPTGLTATGASSHVTVTGTRIWTSFGSNIRTCTARTRASQRRGRRRRPRHSRAVTSRTALTAAVGSEPPTALASRRRPHRRTRRRKPRHLQPCLRFDLPRKIRHH